MLAVLKIERGSYKKTDFRFRYGVRRHIDLGTTGQGHTVLSYDFSFSDLEKGGRMFSALTLLLSIATAISTQGIRDFVISAQVAISKWEVVYSLVDARLY